MWHIDPLTLREVVDDPTAAQRDLSRADAGDRVWLLRLLGRLDEAHAAGEELLRVAADPYRPLLLLADVLCAQGDYERARSLQERAVLLCRGSSRRQATAHQHIGKRLFDQGLYGAAAEAFAAALRLRQVDGDAELVASSALALSRAQAMTGPDDTSAPTPAETLAFDPSGAGGSHHVDHIRDDGPGQA